MIHFRFFMFLYATAWMSLLGLLLPELKAAAGFAVMSKGLGLDGQSRWGYYDGGDAPEGAYLGWLDPNVSVLKGTVSLGRTLSPGRYYVFLKAIDYQDAGNGQIEVVLGGVKKSIGTNNRDENGYWTVSGQLDTLSSVSSIEINLRKTTTLSDEQKYLLIGFYITTDAEEAVGRDDRVTRWHYPSAEDAPRLSLESSEMDNSPPAKGNVLENSSFEVGSGHGWGVRSSVNRELAVPSMIDSTTGHHGKASLKVFCPAYGGRAIFTKVYRLKPNKKYTLSAWVKSTGNTAVTVFIASPHTAPPGYRATFSTSSRLSPVPANWERISVSGNLMDYPNTNYQVNISVDGPEGSVTWIDAVQLEEGELSPYAPAKSLELGLLGNQPGNIYFEDESVSPQLLVYNAGSQSASSSVRYEIYDYLNAKVAGRSVSVNTAAASTSVTNLSASTGRKGIFRAVAWIEGVEGTEEELVFCVVSRPRVTGKGDTPVIGIHPHFTDFEFQMMQKLGIKWARVMSPEAFFRWNMVEPVEGQYVWYDDKIRKATDNNVTIMGTIGTNKFWPAWADDNGLPNLDKWENFVEKIVTHYKHRVKYWEVWNESSYEFTADFYAHMLKRASAAIRRADPTAKIIGMGGVHSWSWCDRVIKILGGTSSMDYISTHLYPGDGAVAADFKKNIIDKYNIPVWNTETGAWDYGFYKGSNSNFAALGVPLYGYLDGLRYYDGAITVANIVAINFLESIGNGISGYFYYDSRIAVDPAYLKSHPTILEYDDSVRAKGVAYSVLAYLFDSSKGLGNLSTDPNVSAYLFDRNGTPLIALWTRDQSAKSLSLSGVSFKVHDLMGNVISTSNPISFNGTPVYIEATGASVDALRTAFRQGTISTRSDTAPPSISIVHAPTGATQNRNLQIRWIALDDVSIPSKAKPYAILYSYQLAGIDSAFSSWTDETWKLYKDLSPGSYTFYVKAKDAAGNTSTTASTTITIVPPMAAPLD
jgi:Y_Y_Y domain/Glycosyl hydrolases family 39